MLGKNEREVIQMHKYEYVLKATNENEAIYKETETYDELMELCREYMAKGYNVHMARKDHVDLIFN